MVLPDHTSYALHTFHVDVPISVCGVELIGSWDGFRTAYSLDKDSTRARGHWKGCFSFGGSVCDGRDIDWKRPRHGALKQGGRYWYYYRLDDREEFCDSSQEVTTACPLLPGQWVNILDVPIESSEQSHDRQHMTLNPHDRYKKLKKSKTTMLTGQGALRDMLGPRASAMGLSKTETYKHRRQVDRANADKDMPSPPVRNDEADKPRRGLLRKASGLFASRLRPPKPSNELHDLPHVPFQSYTDTYARTAKQPSHSLRAAASMRSLARSFRSKPSQCLNKSKSHAVLASRRVGVDDADVSKAVADASSRVLSPMPSVNTICDSGIGSLDHSPIDDTADIAVVPWPSRTVDVQERPRVLDLTDTDISDPERQTRGASQYIQGHAQENSIDPGVLQNMSTTGLLIDLHPSTAHDLDNRLYRPDDGISDNEEMDDEHNDDRISQQCARFPIPKGRLRASMYGDIAYLQRAIM